MALSGVHVACGQVTVLQSVALSRKPVWSRTMPNAGVTDLRAPELPTISFEVRAAVDVFVAIGPNPMLLLMLGSSCLPTRRGMCSATPATSWPGSQPDFPARGFGISARRPCQQVAEKNS